MTTRTPAGDRRDADGSGDPVGTAGSPAGHDPARSGTKGAILEHLKRAETSTVAELAAKTSVTEAAVRLHLDDLARRGLVAVADAPADEDRGRGRPATAWRVTDAARHHFDDRHGELSVHLIAAIRAAFGEEGLDRVIAARTDDQRSVYRAAVPESGPLHERVDALARRRTEEGYMAETIAQDDAVLLVEHHCPICDAATACQGLCRGELELFRQVLGDDVHVERTQHLLSGDTRCIYRIS